MMVVPTVSRAVAGNFDSAPISLAARGNIGSFTPASVDPQLAASFAGKLRLDGKLFRFTPAGSTNRPDRAVTVAIRVTGNATGGFAVRSATAMPGAEVVPGAAPLRIAPTVYNLGMARGYQSFAAAAALPREFERLEMPDLRTLGSGKAVASAPARLAPRIELDEKDRAGRAPRTLESQGNYQVDVGGSYRLTRNLNVTAGIRYSADRDRFRPLTDGKQDNQAVYVGTQFRF